jgi:hypothetical protein
VATAATPAPPQATAARRALPTLTAGQLTDQPYALKRVVPFRVHGQLQTPFVPALVLVPWLTGALKQRKARRYFFSFFAVAPAN